MSTTTNGDIELYYESFGSTDNPTILLVCGLGMQSTGYSDQFVGSFVDRGFHVVRFDNRDSGLSSDGPAEYRLSDMAADGMAVLDAVGVDQAHIFGVSMGGMIVQTMAIEHPARVLSLTSVMSSTGERDYGQATDTALALLTATPPTTREGVQDDSVAAQKLWGSPAYFDEDYTRRVAGEAFDRAYRPAGTMRQFMAIVADRDSRAEKLRALTVPTLVIHGTEDNLINVSGGRRTAELIPGAQLEIIEGMGHDLPRPLVERIVGLTADFLINGPVLK
ncbi:MAG TPA: alpha/beta hydrolase [Ilumatobacteraceae bacterium]|nr:alpha/beta hydrolase [Ilumatobacteraceae bacterium]